MGLLVLALVLPAAAAAQESPPAGGAPALATLEQLRELSERGGSAAKVQLVLRSEATKVPGIRGLTLSEREIPFSVAPVGSRLFTRVEIRGRLDRPGWVLFAQKEAIAGPDSGAVEFRSVIQLDTGASQVMLTAVGPEGQVESDTLLLLAPKVQEYRVTRSWGELTALLGAAHISYAQTELATLYTTNVAFGLDYSTPRGASRWALLARGRMTYFPLATSIRAEEPQMLDARLAVTYRLSGSTQASGRSPRRRWELSALVGAFYQTTLTFGSRYGFFDLVSSDWGGRAEYRLGGESVLRADLRYSMLGKVFEEWGLSGELGWHTRLASQKRLGVVLGWNNIAFNPNATSRAQLNWLQLLIAYGW
jgi:hypothetical protein